MEELDLTNEGLLYTKHQSAGYHPKLPCFLIPWRAWNPDLSCAGQTDSKEREFRNVRHDRQSDIAEPLLQAEL